MKSASAFRARAALAIVALLLPSSLIAQSAQEVVFHVYGYASDAPVKALLDKLAGLGGAYVRSHDLAAGGNGERFTSLLEVINSKADIPFLPDSVERRAAPPYIHYHNQNRYYSVYESTLTGVFAGGKLLAAVMGDTWYGEGFWEELLASAVAAEEGGAGYRVIVPSGTYDLRDERIRSELAALFLGGG